MRFLSPLVLFGLVLIALPVAIHLLVRRRARRLDFPSLVFLRETPSFRLRPRHIQQPLLLALRVAAIACLVLGLSRPLITLGTKPERQRVILLDASLSMGARGRVDAAKEISRRLINELGTGERAAIVAFSTDSLLLSSMTSNKRDLSEAIDRYQPTGGSANYADAFKVTDDLLRSEPVGDVSIDLVSDFQESGLPYEHLTQLDGQVVGHAKIITHPVGTELERNAFLVDEEVLGGESLNEIGGSELLDSPNERIGNRRTWALDARDGARGDIVWRTESNGQITARVATVTPDDFDADDERFLVFEPSRMGRALLVEPDGDDASQYLQAALEATATDLGEKHFTVERRSVLPNTSSELASYSLVTVTLHGSPQPDELHTLANYAREGGLVWLCMGNDVDTNQWNQFANTVDGREFPYSGLERKTDPDQASGFGMVDSEAPALRFMNDQVLTTLRTVRMREGFAVTPRVGSATLMRWNDGTPAFVGTGVGRGGILMLATSPARVSGDLGTSAAFPALVSSITRLGIAPREPLARQIGQPVHLRLASHAPVNVFDAKGKSISALASDLTMHPEKYFPSPGIYRIESDGFAKYLAFNAPETESERSLAPAVEVEKIFKAKNPASSPMTTAWHDVTERLQNAWRYFLLTAFILLITELYVAMRNGGQASMKAKG